MTITQKVAEEELLRLIQSKHLIYKTWVDKKFEAMKFSSTTEKGNLAENFLAALIKSLGYSDVEIKSGRRGDYDVRVGINDSEAKLEVKLATQDTIRYIIILKEWLTTKREISPCSYGKGDKFRIQTHDVI